MKIEFDPAKNTLNQVKHGLSLAEALDFEWETAQFTEDKRQDYGEQRLIATGFIADRLHVLCFTKRSGLLRVISLRKANKREEKDYGQKIIA